MNCISIYGQNFLGTRRENNMKKLYVKKWGGRVPWSPGSYTYVGPGDLELEGIKRNKMYKPSVARREKFNRSYIKARSHHPNFVGAFLER